MAPRTKTPLLLAPVVAALIGAACSSSRQLDLAANAATLSSTDTASTPTATSTTTPPSSTGPPPVDTATDTATSATSTTTTTSTTTSAPATTLVPEDAAAGALPHLTAAFDMLLDGNLAVSITVRRDHVKIFGAAGGLTTGWQQINTDSPMVLASVSKLVTALSVARLAQADAIEIDAPVPWDALGLAHDPGWNDVTVRELLAHTSGMPIARKSWLDDPGSCRTPLLDALATPPRPTRGRWTYSNGNYCALGLLVEFIAHRPLDQVAQILLFDPIGVTGPHLTTAPEPATDGPYALGLPRLERLGGAGIWMASSDDIAALIDAVTPADREVLVSPGIITDQYGWGHTGTVDGAKTCVWVVENGRTVISAFVAGPTPASGGRVCDVVVTSIALDLGFWADRPIRLP